MWKATREKAYALYPYTSTAEGHLNLIQGDILDIVSSNGEWVCGRCVLTGCIGICPSSYVVPYTDDNSVLMKIIETELRPLIVYAFENIVVAAREIDPQLWRLLDLIDHIEQCFPDGFQNEEERTYLIKSINELREVLKFPPPQRSSCGCIMRTHDYDTSELSKAAAVKNITCPETLRLNFQIAVSPHPNQTLMTRCFLYNPKTKQHITHTKVAFLNQAEWTMEYIVPDFDPKLINGDTTGECETALVIQIALAVRGDDDEVDTDYFGIAAGLLSTEEKKFKASFEQNYSLTFYKPKDGLYSTLHEDIINKNMAALVPVEDMQAARIKLNSTEALREATGSVEDNENPEDVYFNIQYPINGSMKYCINSLSIDLQHLKHKTKHKPTRIICRVIDLLSSKNEYLPVFTGQHPDSYETLSQKGSLELDIGEVCQIKLDDKLIPNPTFTYIVFIVERHYKPQSESYVSSYAFMPFVNMEGKLMEYQNGIILKLMKPPKEFNAKTLADRIAQFTNKNICFDPPEDPGYIKVATTLISPYHSSDEKIHRLMTTKIEDMESVEEITINEKTYLFAWGYRILERIAKIIASNNEKLFEEATKAFISLLNILVQNAKYTPYYLHVLNEFKECAFNNDNPEFAKLGTLLLTYISKETKDGKLGNELSRPLDHLMSIASNSVDFAKKMKVQVDEVAFNNAFKQVFNTTTAAIVSADTLPTHRNFLINTFPSLIELMNRALSQKQIIELICQLIDDTTKADEKKEGTPSIIAIAAKLTSSAIFKKYEIRKAILPKLVKALLKHPISPDITKSIFVAMYGTSYSLSDELIEIYKFIRPILDDPKQVDFLVLYFYYACTDVIKEMLTVDDSFTVFSKINHILIDAIDKVRPHVLFCIIPTFFKIVVLWQSKEFFDLSHVVDLIDMISSFYSNFLKRLQSFNTIDRETYSHYYSIDLGPISKLMLMLINRVPEDYHFDQVIFIPLFHMYISTDETSIVTSVKKAVINIFNAEGKKFANIEKPVVHSLIAIMNAGNLGKITTLFDAILEVDRKSEQAINQVKDLAINIANLAAFPSNATYEDERTCAILAILERCKRTNDYSIYPQFCLVLYDLHILLNSYVEAAEVLVDCAKAVKANWDFNEVMEADSIFPKQKSKERIYAMFRKAFDHFMQAQFFERAATVAKELRDYAEEIEMDYEDIADIIELQEKAWSEIVTTERTAVNRFYGAMFFGDGFHEYHKNKMFIYRRGGYFDNGQMLNYIRQKFTNAEVSPQPPTEKDAGKDFIYVFNVKTQFKDDYCPEEAPAARMVKSVCNIDTFTLEVPVRVRIKEKKYNEIAEYHRDITTFKTEYKLQGIARRAEIIDKSKPVRLSPVECAVIDTNAKSLELLEKASAYWRCIEYGVKFDTSAVSSFSMLINGIVNAAVNGGTKLFQELFLEGDLSTKPENKKWAPSLKKAFINQLKVVNFAISVHDKVVHNDFRPLHEQICEQFEIMQETMSQHVGKVDFSDRSTEFGEIPADLK